MNHDWYRRKTWTKTDQKEFFARLARSRGQFHKAQYLRIQALCLQDKYPSDSLNLLQRIVSEFPDPFELAQTYLQMAYCHSVLSEHEEAIQCFRKTLAQEVERPSSLTIAYLDFPVFIVETNRTDLYKEAETILTKNESRLMFPVDHYKFNMCSALISEYFGNSAAASKYARQALSAAEKLHSGFRYHPKFGLVSKQDKKIVKKLTALANIL